MINIKYFQLCSHETNSRVKLHNLYFHTIHESVIKFHMGVGVFLCLGEKRGVKPVVGHGKASESQRYSGLQLNVWKQG